MKSGSTEAKHSKHNEALGLISSAPLEPPTHHNTLLLYCDHSLNTKAAKRSPNPTFLITAATGHQGGAATRHLLNSGARVRVLVRDPSSAAAQALQSLGATLARGSFDDPAALRTACAGITAVFLNSSPSFSEPGAELRHAENVLQAARAAGVASIVYNSVCEAGQHERFPDWENWPEESGLRRYFLSKAAIEDRVRRAGFQRYTIFRPPLFMTNFILPDAKFYMPDLVGSGVLKTALAPGKRAMLMAPDDIGRFVAEAMLNPTKFGGLEMDIGGEALTMEQMAKAFSEVSGREVTSEFIPEGEEVRSMGNTVGQVDVQRWFWERQDKFDPRFCRSGRGLN
ncbi:MAG: hypothetical protein Q9160_008961 [Pyrenula sp. 1 TL-2023]